MASPIPELADIMNERAQREVAEGLEIFRSKVWPLLSRQPTNVGRAVAACIVSSILAAAEHNGMFRGEGARGEYYGELEDSIRLLVERIQVETIQ